MNVFTSYPVKENKNEGGHNDLSQIDWSVRGPWQDFRTLWGLNDFAADIAHWVYQTEGTENSRKILPHHVFELSCIVDSLTVSRGWSLSQSGGHELEDAAQDFSSTRDIDLFLDREGKQSQDLSYLFVITQLVEWLSRDIPWDFYRNDYLGPRNEPIIEEVKAFQIELGHTLGIVGASIQPVIGPTWSRFGKTLEEASGIWNYSPFLCGAGLMEALEIAYRISMKMWDFNFEPIVSN